MSETIKVAAGRPWSPSRKKYKATKTLVTKTQLRNGDYFLNGRIDKDTNLPVVNQMTNKDRRNLVDSPYYHDDRSFWKVEFIGKAPDYVEPDFDERLLDNERN